MSRVIPPIQRYYEGAQPNDFTRAEAAAVAEEIQHRHRNELTNQNHRFHESRSLDVRALYERAYPGTYGPNGELVGGAPDDGGSLFR